MDIFKELEKAQSHVVDLCEGRTKWRMSVPVDEEKDSDCILMNAISLAEAELKRYKELVRQLKDLIGHMEWKN